MLGAKRHTRFLTSRVHESHVFIDHVIMSYPLFPSFPSIMFLLSFVSSEKKKNVLGHQLTQEFVEVMGGARSTSFQKYRSLCVRTFLQARRSREKIITLVSFFLRTCVHVLLRF